MRLIRLVIALMVCSRWVWAEIETVPVEGGSSTEITPIQIEKTETSVPSAEPVTTINGIPPQSSSSLNAFQQEGSLDRLSHQVVKGDTLWDLAGLYLKNYFQWPQIWKANQETVPNPHWIYPGQVLQIPSIGSQKSVEVVDQKTFAINPLPVDTVVPSVVSESAPAVVPQAILPEETEEEEALTQEAKDEIDAKTRKTQAVPGAGFMGGIADSFVADRDWEYDGFVLRDRDRKMMITQGDVVFLNVGSLAGAAPNRFVVIYRVGQKVKDPFLRKAAGRMVKRVGVAFITKEVREESCTAVVTSSLEPIRVGDVVKFAP